MIKECNKVTQAQEGDWCAVGPRNPILRRFKNNSNHSCSLNETEYPLRNYMRGMQFWIIAMLVALRSGKITGTVLV